MKKTKTAAIQYARARVSSLIRFGDGYFYRCYDDKCQAWRESRPQNYWAAHSARSYALLSEAMEFLHGDDCVMPGFYGGNWTDHVKKGEA